MLCYLNLGTISIAPNFVHKISQVFFMPLLDDEAIMNGQDDNLLFCARCNDLASNLRVFFKDSHAFIRERPILNEFVTG